MFEKWCIDGRSGRALPKARPEENLRWEESRIRLFFSYCFIRFKIKLKKNVFLKF